MYSRECMSLNIQSLIELKRLPNAFRWLGKLEHGSGKGWEKVGNFVLAREWQPCITTHCRLYSNISQILLLYKTWRYHNKFDSTKSLGLHYRCVKIPQCGYMEHGLKDIVFYVQSTYNTLRSCHNFPAGSRQAARGGHIGETSLLKGRASTGC